MMDSSKYPKIVLGSTSPFRREILAKLAIPFETASPDIDETRLPQEEPMQLVTRLAEQKARAAGKDFPQALVIGSDQVACVDGDVLGKPGERARAIQQLQKTSGKTVTFYTGLCLLNTASGAIQTSCELFQVHFRDLGLDQISRYVDQEQPFNCAGSFKSEGLGITLFRKLEGDDPNTLIGLPLIRLVEMLEREGLSLP